MAHYFISDLHLSADQPTLVGLFKHFLTTIATDATHLFILGDFFDAWIGDDEDSPAAIEIKQILRSYSDSNSTQCSLLSGNRDFLIGSAFAEETGFTLLEELHKINLYGTPALLLHGDSLCTDDKEYMQFRAQVRSQTWQQQVLSLPLPQRRAMAAQLRTQSKSMNSIKAEDIMDVNSSAVSTLMEEHNVKWLIHGHTHRPAIHDLNNGLERIVLGDWHENHGWYLKVTPESKNLVDFSL